MKAPSALTISNTTRKYDSHSITFQQKGFVAFFFFVPFEILTKCFLCIPVPTEGSRGYSPGPRGSKRHPVATEIHPGGE